MVSSPLSRLSMRVRALMRIDWYIIRNQDLFRSEHMQVIADAVGDGCVDGDAVGKRTIVPSSHMGGRRYFNENFHDGLAVCRVHGAPDVFTTFTCNPKWPEITAALEPGQTPPDRADVIVRVYHMKLAEYLDEIKSGRAFGPIKAVMYTVEFQKRGLPHAHILVWRRGGSGEIGVENINSLISAEIPDALLDPLGYALVSEFMMHGPCGEMNDKCVCMKKGVCSKFFPKDFRDTTVVDDNGFVLYRRRDDGRRVYKNGHYLDNRHVVPYSMAMLKKFQGHINVEWCNKTQVMKYLFKYVTKGADYSKVMLERLKKLTTTGCRTVDEVQEYLICRYICEYDALWRIFGFEIHFKMPSVQRLTVHMPGMNNICYRTGADLTKIVGSDFLQKTMLTEWFVANDLFEDARSLTYYDFPSAWTWDAKSRSWHPRGRGEKIGRVYYVHPLSGELYYLRMLLMIVKGARPFECLRTYAGHLYHTFKEACAARGLLGDDSEWYTTFDEAVVWGFGHRLRELFVTMLMHCSIRDELGFFERYCSGMYDDIQHRLRRALGNPNYVVPPERLRNLLLDELADVFLKHGFDIIFFNLSSRSGEGEHSDDNRLICDELCYDEPALATQSLVMFDSLNEDQLVAYKTIVQCVQSGEPGFFLSLGTVVLERLTYGVQSVLSLGVRGR
ncbi:uncharacterized protein LOC125520269 isoform X2 [Triticum urartu]|uniref:uncharacterized protein LOC125520269 isoform X2 n=1 Tax=Triticum urartu TaxID=4572 RepID=UPI002043A94D|nr:uncharacterized protein LOC125520269 isoform X2 [Triticum urartu]